MPAWPMDRDRRWQPPSGARNSNAGYHADIDAMSEGRPFVLPSRDTHRDV